MTGNNDLRSKGQALFLAAIMVLSMVAMSATFAGAAAANQHDVTVDFEDVEVQPGETVTLTVTSEQADDYSGITGIQSHEVSSEGAATFPSWAEIVEVQQETECSAFTPNDDNDAGTFAWFAAETNNPGEPCSNAELGDDLVTVVFQIDESAEPGDEFTFASSNDQTSMSVADGDQEQSLTTEINAGSVTVIESQQGPFTVSDLQPADASVPQGAEIDVSATITNEGEEAGSTSASLIIADNEIASKTTEEISAGGTDEVVFENVNTSSLDPGQYTHTIETPDDSQDGSLEILDQPEDPFFSVSNLQPETVDVQPGAGITVSADITNEGASDGEKEVRFTLGGEALATQDVQIPSGETQTVSFEVNAPEEAGEYTHGIETDDGSQTGTLTVSDSDEEDTFGDLANRYWHGQVVLVEGVNPGEVVEVYRVEGDDRTFVRERTANADGELLLRTGRLDENNDYQLERAELDNNPTSDVFAVTEQTLDEFGFANSERRQDQSGTVSVSSNRAGFKLEISEEDGNLNGEDLAGVFGDQVQQELENSVVVDVPSDEASFSASFGNVETGNYTFVGEVVDTSADGSSDLEITQAQQGTLEFTANNYRAQRGDTITFGVNFEGLDDSVVRIEDTTSNYKANLSVKPEDGQALINWNTHYAGTGNPDQAFTAVQGEVEVIDETPVTTDTDPRIAEDDYDLTVFEVLEGDSANFESGFSEDNIDENAVSLIGLIEPDSRALSATPHVAPRGSIADDAGREDVLDLVTQRDTVADEDYLVLQFGAEGVFGYLQGADGSLDPTDQGLSVQITGPKPKYGQPPTFTTENDGIDLVPAEGESEFFVIVDTREVGLQPGLQYDATFTIDNEANDYLASAGAEEPEQASTSFTVAERRVEVTGVFNDDDVLQVPNTAESDITVRTPVAPGTEVFIRARARSPAPFLQDTTVEVTEDNTATATFDFSEREVGTEFTITARENLGQTSQQVDAVFGEGPEGAFFGVSGLTPQQATVEPGDTVDVSATVTNEGDETATQTVEFTLDGDVIDSEELELEPGESATVEFSTEAPDVDETTEFTHAVSTEDGDASGTLTVEVPDPDDDDTTDDDTTDDDTTDDDTTDDDTTDDDTTDDGEDDEQPGFGIALALLAILGAALLARRRQ